MSFVGWRVLELPGAEPVARAGRYLADLGADVVAVRSEGPSALDRGKRVATPGAWVEPARANADLVLGGVGRVGVSCTGPPGSPAELEERAGTWDPPFGPPRYHGLAVANVVAGAWVAIGGAAGVLATERGQPGRRVEIDALAAGLSAHELAAALRLDPPSQWSPLRWAGSPFVGAYPARDGRWLFVHLALPRHLERLLEHLQLQHPPHAIALRSALSQATFGDPLSVGSVREGVRVRRVLGALFRTADAAGWEEELSTAGLCGVVCRTAAEWREHPQARADGQVVELGGHLVCGPPVHVRGVPALRLPVEVEGVSWLASALVPTLALGAPLAGIKVLDLTRVIAGPVAGRTLATLGAEVTKIVDPREIQSWVEAFRSVFDAGKRVVELDLSTLQGRRALRDRIEAERPDVILHNFRPSAADRLGLLEHELRTAAPDAVLTVISAYGPRGPWTGRPGWEQTAQAVVGTQLEYGGGPAPALVPLPATDLATGLFAALGTLAGLRSRARGDLAPRVDASLTAAQLQLRDHAPTPIPLQKAPGLVARLAQVPGLTVRSERPGLGAITELGAPITSEGVPRVLPGPGAVVGAPGARPKARVWASNVRWATLALAGRLPFWKPGASGA